MAELDPDYRMRGRPELAMLLADLLRRGYLRWRNRGGLGPRTELSP
ncbi:hypothetical protein LTV02_23570 [Nocardia yamanashiensis]|nr:hypothetical protein [Nocardia yamanashiensis]UGT39068.1 hypothetical protein LTV02_23570 [Nocardia yamanashiensis]